MPILVQHLAGMATALQSALEENKPRSYDTIMHSLKKSQEKIWAYHGHLMRKVQLNRMWDALRNEKALNVLFLVLDWAQK